MPKFGFKVRGPNSVTHLKRKPKLILSGVWFSVDFRSEIKSKDKCSKETGLHNMILKVIKLS